MKRHLSFALVIATVAAALVGAAAQARSSSGTVVALKKTALGSVLVDARGRTLYLFEKDRNGASACTSACTVYWPKLISRSVPRAGSGVHQSLLRVNRAGQVTYAGHPLYTFVGDKRAGQTAGEGLTDFGASWYVVSAAGTAIDHDPPPANNGGGYGY